MSHLATISSQPVQAAQSPVVSTQPQFETSVHAGFPSPATDYLQDSLDLNSFMVQRKSATYFFDVAGDSMKNIGIFDGDKVVVDKSIDPLHNMIVIAIYNDQYTLKRLVLKDDKVELCPENENYKTIVLEEGNELIIWGVVTGVIRKFRM